MAKITGPLMSMTASGALAKGIIFGRTTGHQIAKRWHQPSGAPSTAQTTRRERYQGAIIYWHGMTANQKNTWSQAAKAIAITGFNHFVSHYLKTNPPIPPITWDAGATVWDDGITIWMS